MRGVHLAAGASRTDRAGNAKPIQSREQPLGIAPGQGEIRRVRQAVRGIAMEKRVRETLAHAGFKIIAQRLADTAADACLVTPTRESLREERRRRRESL